MQSYELHCVFRNYPPSQSTRFKQRKGIRWKAVETLVFLMLYKLFLSNIITSELYNFPYVMRTERRWISSWNDFRFMNVQRQFQKKIISRKKEEAIVESFASSLPVAIIVVSIHNDDCLPHQQKHYGRVKKR